MSTDIKLDLRTHDIDLSSGTAVLFSDNPSVVGQRIKIAVLKKRGEWFRDIQIGVPYYQEFFLRKNNKPFIDQFFINYISDIEDVKKVISYSSEIDIPNRILTVTFSVETYEGQIVNVTVGESL